MSQLPHEYKERFEVMRTWGSTFIISKPHVPNGEFLKFTAPPPLHLAGRSPTCRVYEPAINVVLPTTDDVVQLWGMTL